MVLILSFFEKKENVNFGGLNSKEHLVRYKNWPANSFCILNLQRVACRTSENRQQLHQEIYGLA